MGAFSLEQINQNLSLLSQLLTCNEKIDLWCFDSEGDLLSSNNTDFVLNTIFDKGGCKEYMLTYGKDHTAPLILGAPLGLMWGVGFEYQNGQLFRAHVIGPVFSAETTLHNIEESFSRYSINLNFKIELLKVVPKLPVISSILLYEYVLMLHYCVTGEKLCRSDIALQEGQASGTGHTQKYKPRDRHKVYENERALLRMVREGDLNYQEVFNRAGQLSYGVRAQNGKPLEQAMVSCTTFVSLITRAAIEGGLSPESAYTLGDGYIQSIMQSKSVAEMAGMANTAYDDFVRRVHKIRQSPSVSPHIRQCCDYIEMHLETPLTLKSLAAAAGYTEYYLSRKFKQEMGINISEYIRFARVERAKTLLHSTDLSVADVADLLQFCSSSHFSKIFQSVTGKTPMQWRSALT